MRPRLAGCPPGVDLADRVVQVVRHLVHVAGRMAPLGAGRVDLDGQAGALIHGDGQRLGATHPAKARGQGGGALEGAVEVLARGLGEGLVGALDDSLGRDVDPGTGRHLAVHRQAGALQLAELLPGRPVGDQVGVGDQDSRRILRGAEDADRLAALDQERLVVLQPLELGDDGVEGFPAARRATGAAIDDEVVRVLGHLRIEVVHEHPERGFLLPALAGDLHPARCADGART